MTMTAASAKTPLYDWHVAHGGRMVDFAGWSMPVQYTSIGEEHQATRQRVGVFDISHMGRLQFFGPAAAEFLDAVVTRRVTDMKPGQIRYALVCNEQGGILDDVLVYRLATNDSTAAPAQDDDLPTFQVVVNASNRSKVVAWFSRRAPDYAVRLADVTADTAMIAVQGPRAIGLVNPQLACDLSTMRYYTGANSRFKAAPCFVSRTGYTGEDGCEIICAGNDAADVWEAIVASGDDLEVQPVGLGARDTLRLEAAMPLYGHELSESINPFQAGLSFAVNLAGREFAGRAALEKLASDKNQPVRVGLQLDGRRVPRQGCAVLQGDVRVAEASPKRKRGEGEIVGEITSGTFSPTFERPIAMAYVRPSAQAVGTRLAVDIRGTPHAAVVVPLPFYERGKRN